jgi:hypothetical protein
MTIKIFLHTSNKRAETSALIDCEATENFISEKYARWLGLPFRCLPKPKAIFNVDGTPNKQGAIQFYPILEVQTGNQHKRMAFFLTELEGQNMILGYPWFSAIQS